MKRRAVALTPRRGSPILPTAPAGGKRTNRKNGRKDEGNQKEECFACCYSRPAPNVPFNGTLPNDTNSLRNFARSSSPIPTSSNPACCDRTNRTTACIVDRPQPRRNFYRRLGTHRKLQLAVQQAAVQAQHADRRRIFSLRRGHRRRNLLAAAALAGICDAAQNRVPESDRVAPAPSLRDPAPTAAEKL